MRLLITGGAGYLGTHLLAALLGAGHEVVVLDSLETSGVEGIARAEWIAGRRCHFVHGRVGREQDVRRALWGVNAVVHLAALKHAGESVRQPRRYLDNNVGELEVLLRELSRAGVRRLVFASSAAVYGDEGPQLLGEEAALCPGSPYAESKLLGERLLQDCADREGWSVVSLRCFNPVGAHPSGLLGESPVLGQGLVPRAMRALRGADSPLTLFGADYDTPDGTCVRDFVHVSDVVEAHEQALRGLNEPGHRIINLGAGRPVSVRELLRACARGAGRPVPCVSGPRRSGDRPMAVACVDRLRRELGLRAPRSLQEQVDSAWRWTVRWPDALGRTGPGEGLAAARDHLAKVLEASRDLRTTA